MKRIFSLGIVPIFLLFLWGCVKDTSLQEISAVSTTVSATSSPEIYWYGLGWGCVQRDLAVGAYSRVEIDGSDFITSSEGSLVTGYYENKELRIIKIAVYQSRHKLRTHIQRLTTLSRCGII